MTSPDARCGNCKFSFPYHTLEEPTRLGCAIDWTSVEKTFPNLTPVEAIQSYGFPSEYVRSSIIKSIKNGESCWAPK